MHQTAYISRPDLEVGASLFVLGSQLFSGDTLTLNNPDKSQINAKVASFGMARLVIETPAGQFECRPWKQEDEAITDALGPGSRWTVGKILR
jgi:hypothetical protein